MRQTIDIFLRKKQHYVSEIYFIQRYGMDCKEHNQENKVLKITKWGEEWGSVFKVTNKTTGPKPAAHNDDESESRVTYLYVELLGLCRQGCKELFMLVLTIRLLMSYIYIYIYIYMEHLFLMFLDHTQRRSTVGRTPLDEW